MGKDLKGKEIGKGFCQRENGSYSARYYDRFGKRQTIYDKNLAELKRLLKTAKFDDEHGTTVVDNSLTLSKWFKTWIDILFSIYTPVEPKPPFLSVSDNSCLLIKFVILT